MLTISDLTYRVGGKRGRALLDHAGVQIPEGSKLGLVGRNGIGKSTLLDLIRGRLAPDDGDIFLPRGRRIGFLAQEAPSGEATPLATVLAADRERARLLAELDAGPAPEHIAEIEAQLDTIGARAAPARAARILAGLGFDGAMQEAALGELSGGWRMRVALAAVLFAEPDLLLLDEPTNHLDMEASLWLERYLRRYRHSFILVSHDRQLLNASTSAILHLETGKLTLYSGNFDAFLRARGAAKARQAAVAKRQDAQRRHMQAFVDRFRYKASKARQAQSRLKALAKLEPVAMIAEAPPIELQAARARDLAAAADLAGGCERRLCRRQADPVGSRSAARPGRPGRSSRRQRQRQDDLRATAGRAAAGDGRADNATVEARDRVFRPAPDRRDAAGRIGL
jgi:ATP-binding cassette subfamily F protein 3